MALANGNCSWEGPSRLSVIMFCKVSSFRQFLTFVVLAVRRDNSNLVQFGRNVTGRLGPFRTA